MTRLIGARPARRPSSAPRARIRRSVRPGRSGQLFSALRVLRSLVMVGSLQTEPGLPPVTSQMAAVMTLAVPSTPLPTSVVGVGRRRRDLVEGLADERVGL